MDENRCDRDRTSPLDDLSPALRRAVEGVLREPLPEDVTRRALAAARRVETPRPETERPALRWRPRAAWRVLALAASIGLVAALAWWHWGGPLEPPTVVKSPPPPVGPGIVQPVPQGPEAPPGDRLPTLWAYRRAAGQSAEALDAMLDRDARWVLRRQPESFDEPGLLRSLPQTL